MCEKNVEKEGADNVNISENNRLKNMVEKTVEKGMQT